MYDYLIRIFIHVFCILRFIGSCFIIQVLFMIFLIIFYQIILVNFSNFLFICLILVSFVIIFFTLICLFILHSLSFSFWNLVRLSSLFMNYCYCLTLCGFLGEFATLRIIMAISWDKYWLIVHWVNYQNPHHFISDHIIFPRLIW